MTSMTITKNDWLTFADLTRQTGISEPTLRRYAKLFGTFMQNTVMDHVTRFEPRAVQVLADAAAFYACGVTNQRCLYRGTTAMT